MRTWTAGLALLSALTAGCREGVKVGDGPYADKVAADVPLIEHALGVRFKTAPRIEIRSRDQVREFLLQKLREPDVEKQIAHQQATFKVLGMLPDTFHLADFFVRVLTEQIIGYYDAKTKVLYVVKDAPDDVVGITVMHELVHALQDQYMNLDSLEHISGDDDRAAAVQAVIEGQATYEQVYIMAGGSGNIAVQLPGGWESMRATIREAQRTQPVFSSAPMVIQETLLFPYINGADFVRRYKARHRAQLPIDTFPVSTAQVMHDSAYFGRQKEIPRVVTLPPVANVVDENDLGEFGSRLFIFQHTHDQDESIRATTGWRGDRYALVKTAGGGYGLAWVTVLDSPAAGAEFMSAIDAVMLNRFNIKPRVTGELRHFDAGTRVVEVNVREIDGRPVVLYIDVPAGTSTSILDFSKVKVSAR